jgi:ABC-type branched-subunit amino acid transport system substrate-binding protein/mono/diheme cytochrome c family protein
VRWRRLLGGASGALLAATAVALAAQQERSTPTLELGRRIYRDGILPSGQPLRARVQGDVAGERLACAGCHGRSGLGGSEGRIVVPPVAGSELYRARETRRPELYASRTVRPAYDDRSLAQAIRAGIDPAGRPLDPLMPRYALADDELQPLIAYLKSLAAGDAPGVTATDIHFATIFTEGVDTRRRQAMLAVMQAFFAGKRAETRHETSRAERSPLFMEWHYQAHRRWNLHVWELHGAAASWRAQLERHYARQPVFAVIGGSASGAWRPIHDFCERQQLPCLLPETELPAVEENDYYTLYFSKGVTLAAQVVDKHLSVDGAPLPVVQVFRADERGQTAAAALQQALRGRGLAAPREVALAAAEPIAPAFWQALARDARGARVVLWLTPHELPSAAALAALEADRIYLTAAPPPLPSVPPPLRDRLYAVDPFDRPEDAARRQRALGVWMRSKGIALTDERVQANTLFTLTLVAQALKHVGSHFDRDYFLQRVEHVFDSLVTPAGYPKLSLGPNQRFAVKGSYVVPLGRVADGAPPAAAEWIVP